jgi:hypothetical protein
MLASSVSLESVAEILGGRLYSSLKKGLHLFRNLGTDMATHGMSLLST